jgi:hypothetical protein
MLKVRIRCIAQQPILLFGKWIYPGETRGISPKQWNAVQETNAGVFEPVPSVQRGDYIEAKAAPHSHFASDASGDSVKDPEPIGWQVAEDGSGEVTEVEQKPGPGLEALVGPRIAHELRERGYWTAANLSAATDAELLDVPGIGPRTLQRIRESEQGEAE